MSNRNSPKKRARLSGENLFVYIRSYIAKFPSGVQSSQVNDDYAKNYQGSFAYCLRMALNLNTNKCKLDKLLSYVPGVITTASSNGTVIYTLASQVTNYLLSLCFMYAFLTKIFVIIASSR